MFNNVKRKNVCSVNNDRSHSQETLGYGVPAPEYAQKFNNSEQFIAGGVGRSFEPEFFDLTIDGLRGAMKFIRVFVDANNENTYHEYPNSFNFSYSDTLHGTPYWTELVDSLFDKAPELAPYLVKYYDFLANYYASYRRLKKDALFDKEEYPKKESSRDANFTDLSDEAKQEKTPEDLFLENFTMPEGLVSDLCTLCQVRCFSHSELLRACRAIIAVRKDPTVIHWVEHNAYDEKYSPERRPLEEAVLTLFERYGLTDNDSIVSGAYYITKHLYGGRKDYLI